MLNVSGGARVIVPGSLAQTTTYILLEQEDWFEEEIRFVRRWLQPGMHAIDVGANLGLYTAAMANAVGAAGTVWAFEPAPATVGLLRRTVELNRMHQVNVQSSAVSEHMGTVGFALKERSEDNAVSAGGAAGENFVEVPSVTLDRMAREHQWRDVDLLKLDVEGHEIAALRGAAEFLRAQSPLVMFEIKTKSRMDLAALRMLAELGYSSYRLLPGPLLLEPFDAESVDPSLLNLFACKPDRAARLATAGFLVGQPAGEVRMPSIEKWGSYARTAPYCGELSGDWPATAGLLSGSGLREYLQALAAYVESRDPGKSAAERHGLLYRALELAGEALASEDSVARRITCSRIMDDAGDRNLAADMMHRTLRRLEEEDGDALAVPFLAPLERFERLAPGANARAWLRCAVTEQFEKRRNYSSMFDPGMTRTLLEPILDNAFRSAEMERRWQLARMAGGMQDAPRSAPLLCRQSEENLNPQFWCPGSARPPGS